MSNPFEGLIPDDDLDEFTAKWRGLSGNNPVPPTSLREALAIWDVWVSGADSLMPGEDWADVWEDEHLLGADAILEIITNHPDTRTAIAQATAEAGVESTTWRERITFEVLEELDGLRGEP